MSRSDYIWVNEDKVADWHAERKQKILKDHPEVKTLMGIEPITKYLAVLMTASQLVIAIYSVNLSWFVYLLSAYFVGATLMQTSFLFTHEITHNTVFKKVRYNRIFAYVIQTPAIVAYHESFRFYHTSHHLELTREGGDPDIPSVMEAKFTRQGVLAKMMWLQTNLITYILRPMFVKNMPFSWYLLANWTVQMTFNIGFFMMYGISPFLYLMLSAFLAGGIHPLAAHFITEHYNFPGMPEDQETSSYYGPFNMFIWNAGYHVEHHDFKSIPWTRLPDLRKMVPEYYDSLYQFDSYVSTIYSFITDARINGFCRVRRVRSNMTL